jgi:hypothetical protein
MLPAYNFYPNNSDLVDASLVDPTYRHDGLSLGYSYLDNPYLAIPQVHSPVPLHHRPPSDSVRPRTPAPYTDLSFTPISQQLVYPATRRIDPNPPAPHSTPPSMLDFYAATSQQLFPTPSELLSNINHPQQSCQRDISESHPYIHSPPPPQTSRQQSPEADASTAPLNSAVNKTESQRKARQRAMAEEIGFTPTDPYVSRLPFSFSYHNTLTPGIPSRRTRKSATISSVWSNTSSIFTSSSDSCRRHPSPWNVSRHTADCPLAAYALSSCICRIPTRLCTKALLSRSKW